MKTIKRVVSVAMLVLLATACNKQFGWIKGKGPTETEIRTVTGFNKISLDMDAEVKYEQDSLYYVEVSAQENILGVLRTEVSAGELKIDTKRWVRKSNPITLIIHSPEIHALKVSGSGNISANNPITTSWLDLQISGSGNISLGSLQAQELETTISGSGDVTINGGNVNNEKFKISGSGDINARYLTSQNAACTISGSGNMTIEVIQSLDATISGSGNIMYAGNPAVNAHISGSGSVTHL